MAQQTAVEFYADKQLELHQKLKDNQISMIDFVVQSRDLLIQAKEIEKQQKIGLLKWMNKVASEEPMRLETDFDDIVEQYYNETYGK